MRPLSIILFVAHVSIGCNTRREGTEANDCTDRADNDGDGHFDCEDEGCRDGPDCIEKSRKQDLNACIDGDFKACRALNLKGVEEYQQNRYIASAAYGHQEECSPAKTESCEQACILGSIEGCLQMAQLHSSGEGVEVDEQQELLFLERACRNGHARTCNDLGNRYRYGSGTVEKDEHTALLYLRKACDIGAGYACTRVGTSYEGGDPRAVPLYIKACKDKDAAGCGKAGMSYKFGYGVNQSDTLAEHYYYRACRYGHDNEELCEKYQFWKTFR